MDLEEVEDAPGAGAGRDAGSLTGVERRAFLLVTVVAAALAAWCVGLADGWRSADAVEYLERARAFVAGEALIDAQEIRPMGVSLLFVPLFLAADAAGAGLDAPWITPAARALAALLAVLTVVAAAALGRRAARAAGGGAADAAVVAAVAGLVVCTSPVFLGYAGVPLADMPAALAVTVGLLLLARPERAGGAPLARGLAVGAAAGLALLAAYKTLPLALLLVACAVGAALAPPGPWGARGRRALITGAGACATLGGAVLLQCGLDARTYGGFGSGFVTYFGSNAGPLVGKALLQLGDALGFDPLRDLAARIYRWGAELIAASPVDLASVSRDTADLRGVQRTSWYVEGLASFLTWPALALLALGLPFAVLRPGARQALLLAGCYALLTSTKGAKDFRLWLPILPALAVVAGLGGRALAGAARARLERTRGALLAGLLLVAGGAAALQHARSMEREGVAFAAFADAARWLDEHVSAAERAADGAGDGRVALASSYHWAVLLRTGPHTDLVKLPRQLDRWATLGPEERAADLAALDAEEALVLHHALLTSPGHEALHGWVAERFTVTAAFWDRAANPLMGPILALVREGHPAASDHRLLTTRVPAPDAPEATRPGLSLERGDLGERLTLLDWRLSRLPGDGLGWLELTLRADTGALAGGVDGARTGGYWLRTRVQDPLGRWSAGDVHAFGRNLAPSGSWPRGQIVTDASLLDPVQGTPYAPALGAGPRGAAPAELWLDVFTRDGARVLGRLELVLPGAAHAERDDAPGHLGPSDDGWSFARDGAFRAATLALPGAPGQSVGAPFVR